MVRIIHLILEAFESRWSFCNFERQLLFSIHGMDYEKHITFWKTKNNEMSFEIKKQHYTRDTSEKKNIFLLFIVFQSQVVKLKTHQIYCCNEFLYKYLFGDGENYFFFIRKKYHPGGWFARLLLYNTKILIKTPRTLSYIPHPPHLKPI